MRIGLGSTSLIRGNNKSGFTLLELLIASSIFLILIALASGTFIQTLRTQRIITNLTESMNNAAFTIEQIAREVRLGFNFNDRTGEVDTLTFTNSDGDDISYKLITYNGGESRGIGRCTGSGCTDYAPITSPDVYVEKMSFVLKGAERGDGFPPRITILITVKGEKDIRVSLQTTISSRVIDS